MMLTTIMIILMMMMETVKVYAGEDGRLGLSYLMQRKELCAVTIYKDNV